MTKRALRKDIRKCRWTTDEDAALVSAVQTQFKRKEVIRAQIKQTVSGISSGRKNTLSRLKMKWTEVAKTLKTRPGKQCRER